MMRKALRATSSLSFTFNAVGSDLLNEQKQHHQQKKRSRMEKEIIP